MFVYIVYTCVYVSMYTHRYGYTYAYTGMLLSHSFKHLEFFFDVQIYLHVYYYVPQSILMHVHLGLHRIL